MDQTLKLVNNTGLSTEQNLCYVNTALQLLNNIPYTISHTKQYLYFFRDFIFQKEVQRINFQNETHK